MTQLVLGIGHKSRHGKDSFAEAIENHYVTQYYAASKHGLATYKPVIVQRISFADPLYQEVNKWLASPYSKSWLLGTNKFRIVFEQENDSVVIMPDWVVPDPKAEVSVRAPHGKHAKLLQWWGTEYRRAQDSEYWVKQWRAGINPKANIVMATDMRFLNEAAAVENVKGFTVSVGRLNLDGSRFIDTSRDPLHASETQLDGYNYDYRITVKTGDLALLDEWAVTLVHYLRALKGHK